MVSAAPGIISCAAEFHRINPEAVNIITGLIWRPPMDDFNRMTVDEIAAAIPDGALLGVPADYSGVPMAALT